MDSFYDQPRRAPIPRGLSSTTDRIPSVPSAVPDVSMLVQNKGNIPQKKSEMSYNAWKYQLRGGATNKENTEPSKESLFRKQVRFEAPQTTNVGQHVPNFNVLPVRPSLVNKQFNQEVKLQKTVQNQPETERFGMPRSGVENKILQAKPFEKIYMANVPNRNLDLSVIEPPKHWQTLQRSNSAPERFHNVLTQTNAESTTLELNKPQTQQVVPVVEKSDDEPTVKDLLKIIQQQNEQLMCLQQQVTTLLRERSQQPQIEANNDNWQQPVFKNKILDNVLQGQTHPASPRGNKFAIDVMTSFEVSIRAPNVNRFNAKRFPASNEAKITEILDESSKNCKTDLSLKLDEPLIVHERCPSPENSIHVDMKDFSSDEEEEQQQGVVDNSMIGWTIYNNVMDQVNFMLKKSAQNQPNTQNQQYTGVIMKQVKDATLKHLQSVGVDLNNVDDDITISTDAAYTPTQVSFAVKQLLMKYLPDDQLAKVAAKSKPKIINNNPKNLIKRRPDFSMATVQYMEKYNLLNQEHKTQENGKFTRNPRPVPSPSDKMLDITALKQQPKLL
ncbi:uncharacterized protein [Atheta coriaria]|uniref:uncharacterized protein n=1 Tax=Dalotia coriaria TaxID=877792 RepID=UPI0031F38BBD